MGISISGPSTQIPVEVVEVGNEITQNQLNAISASNLPSTGNPFTTTTVTTNIANVAASSYSLPKVTKASSGAAGWSGFTLNAQFPLLAYNHYTDTWWPIAPAGSLLGVDQNSATPTENSYYFDFTDDTGNYIALNGIATTGTHYSTAYISSGGWDSNLGSTYYNGTYGTTLAATGPSYAGDWSNPITSAQYYDSSYNVLYRYVYLDGSGGFYTADNSNNPPS